MNEAKIYASNKTIENNTTILPEFHIICEITEDEFNKAIVFMQNKDEWATKKAFLKTALIFLAMCLLFFIVDIFLLPIIGERFLLLACEVCFVIIVSREVFSSFFAKEILALREKLDTEFPPCECYDIMKSLETLRKNNFYSIKSFEHFTMKFMDSSYVVFDKVVNSVDVNQMTFVVKKNGEMIMVLPKGFDLSRSLFDRKRRIDTGGEKPSMSECENEICPHCGAVKQKGHSCDYCGV